MRSPLLCVAASSLISSISLAVADTTELPTRLPAYSHIVVVLEENKDYDEIIGRTAVAPYINKLATEGASLAKMYGEEHNSEGNYFWLLSGSDQGVQFDDEVPRSPILASSLGEQLIKAGRSFKGYSESMPDVGFTAHFAPAGCEQDQSSCLYARKHVPWISFQAIPNSSDPAASSNLRWSDFPADYKNLPTVAFVVPNLVDDMHNGHALLDRIKAGDTWLANNIDKYYQWAKLNNSLLIVTFDESDDHSKITGLTDPGSDPHNKDLQNHIPTIFAGAHVKPGYAGTRPATHVNILRTIEAMYGLSKSGSQQQFATRAGISDGPITEVFQPSN